MFNKMFLCRSLRRWQFCSTKAQPLLQRALEHQKLRDHEYSLLIDQLLRQNHPQTAFRVLLNLNSVILDSHAYYNIYLGLKENKCDISYTEVLYKMYREHFHPMPIMLGVMKTLLRNPGSEHLVRHDMPYYEANRRKHKPKDDDATVKDKVEDREDDEEEEDIEHKPISQVKEAKSKQKKKKVKKAQEADKVRIYSQRPQKPSAQTIPLKQFKVNIQHGKPFTMDQKLASQLSKLINPFSQYNFNIHDVNIQFESFNDRMEQDSQEQEDIEFDSDEEDAEYTLMDVLAGVKNIRVGRIEIIRNKNDQ